MIRKLVILAMLASLFSQAHAQSSDVPTYIRKFGKEDRVGFQTEKALALLGNKDAIQQQVVDATLFVDCGSQNRPATGFVLDMLNETNPSCNGRIAVTAAHNVKMALDNNRTCTISGPVSAELSQSQLMISPDFQDTGLAGDQAFDFALMILPKTSSVMGYTKCTEVDVDSAYCPSNKSLTVVQSMSSHVGTMGLSPQCCLTQSMYPDVLTSTCKGYYKSSGAPVLKIRENDVCVAGVYNAYNGQDYGFKSYAASLNSESFSGTMDAFISKHCPAE